MNVVELSAISKVYGKKRAVDHLDMTVKKAISTDLSAETAPENPPH